MKFLWARKRIELLDDYGQVRGAQDSKKEVTQLGLKYGLLTAYTSFIAVDEETRNPLGNATTVSQPLPLPQGVSDKATGYRSGSAMGNVKRKFRMQSAYATQAEMARADEVKVARSSAKLESQRLANEEVILDEPEVFDLNDMISDSIVIDAYMVDSEPTFIGGESAMIKFIKENLNESAKGLTGTIYVQFVVDESGKVTEVKVIRGGNKKLKAEALRLVKSMPHWNPENSLEVPYQLEWFCRSNSDRCAKRNLRWNSIGGFSFSRN